MEIIAEIGQNHNGEINLAIELIHAAKENGADTVKFQVYDAIALFPKKGNVWFEYNCKTQITRDQLHLLMEECQKVKIEFLASAFDTNRIKWLESAGINRYKIASRSIYDKKLIRCIAETGKPIIASLGMWNEKVFPLVETSSSIKFLYCVSNYPTQLNEVELDKVDFKRYSGFSDHTVGIVAAVVAFSRGAQIVEKHFTLDKSMYGPDHSCSMTPDELKLLHDYRLQISQCL